MQSSIEVSSCWIQRKGRENEVYGAASFKKNTMNFITDRRGEKKPKNQELQKSLTLFGSLLGRASLLPEASGLLSTPTGTMTLGGVAVAPSADTCW